MIPKIKKIIYSLLPAVVLMLVLPLIGIIMAGRSINQYLEFPPSTRYISHAPFSCWAFITMALIIITGIIWLYLRFFPKTKPLSPPPLTPKKPLPWWGWLSLLIGIIFWILAWSRFSWFESLQLYTFTPLWLAYIIFINAITYKRTGNCLMVTRFRLFCALFPVSTFFWWFFEYLNRFVQNWYYIGEKGFSSTEYLVLASLSFSIVLPAVLSTAELLKTHHRRFLALEVNPPRPLKITKIVAWGLLGLSLTGLTLIAIFPNFLFPLLWLAPLLIIGTTQVIKGQKSILSHPSRHTWASIFLMALAALVCGFFWGMWNYFSLAKWIYEVPFVSAFKIFEMPILGYAGYLPFGIECAVIIDLVAAEKILPTTGPLKA